MADEEDVDEMATNDAAKTEDSGNKDANKDEWSRTQVAQSIVNRHVAAASAAGLIPIPLGDVAGISATALNLIKRLSDLYEVGFSREAGLNVIATLVSGAAPLALKATAMGMLKAIPGVGTFAGMAAMPILGGSTVYAIGQVMIRHYESGGNLLNFDAQGANDYFRQQMASQQQKQAAS